MSHRVNVPHRVPPAPGTGACRAAVRGTDGGWRKAGADSGPQGRADVRGASLAQIDLTEISTRMDVLPVACTLSRPARDLARRADAILQE